MSIGPAVAAVGGSDFAVRTLEVVYALSLFGAIGALPALLRLVAQTVGYAKSSRRGATPPLRRGLLIAFAASLLGLQGCAHTMIGSRAPNRGGEPNTIRTLGTDGTFSDLSEQSVARRVQALRGGEAVAILALSGGGADGAFGAGALVGLTRAQSRSQFEVVSGVSAGALIAPYAFLGPAWDAQLVEIYTTGQAQHLLQPRALGALFGSSIYSGTPLHELVDHYATDAVIQAVAHEAAAGRLLLIVTTDVETGEPVVWDLGSIAMNGGQSARALFRDVLVASASVPGMFPPVVIRVNEQRAIFEEAHVDGSVSVPFFVLSGFNDRSHGPKVYVIVDGQLSEPSLAVPLRARSIVSRSVATGINHMTRTMLELTASNAYQQGAELLYSAIPSRYPTAAAFDFRAGTMRSLFEYGYECARAGRLWISAPGVDRPADPDQGLAAQRIPCPVDDEFLAYVPATVNASPQGGR
ncbi:MAG TPA: patatin-like phospholipase family protein [Steroidobacteraceae bacterium]|jgi:predicted acylesterase/phospholipase RssA